MRKGYRMGLFGRRTHCTFLFFFFFNDTATTEIYTLSLHDALPICVPAGAGRVAGESDAAGTGRVVGAEPINAERGSGTRNSRSEEHTSELQSQSNLVCRLLLEKKKKKQ